MKNWVRAGLAAMLAIGAAMATPGLTQRSDSEIARLDLAGTTAAVRSECAALTGVTSELARRYPDQTIDAPDCGAQPSAAEVARLRTLDDDALIAEIRRHGEEIERLVTRGEQLKAAAQPAHVTPTPPATNAAGKLTRKDEPAPSDTKAYCKAMYGKAYMLCNRDDRSCKFLAASHWESCEKTGRWP